MPDRGWSACKGVEYLIGEGVPDGDGVPHRDNVPDRDGCQIGGCISDSSPTHTTL